MPTYEYKCDNCGHEFEIYQSMKDEKLTKCPECGKLTLKRLIGSGSGLIFKGSGFYLTDYKNKPESKPQSRSNPDTSKKDAEKTKTAADAASASKAAPEKSSAPDSSKKSAEKNTEKKGS